MMGTNTPAAHRSIRTDANDPAFRELVAELDKDLAIRDGNDHAFFAQFNKLHDIRHAVVVCTVRTPLDAVRSNRSMGIRSK